MSIQAMTWVWGLEGLDTSQTMVLLALADAANDDGFACWPSQETLARKSRMSVRSVKRHIVTLRDAGLIDVEMQSSTRGRMANLYRLHVGAERDFSALSRQRVKLAPSNSASGEIVDIPAKGQIDPLRNDGSNEVPKGTPMTPTKGTRVSPCNIGTVIKNHQTKPNQTHQEELPEKQLRGNHGGGLETLERDCDALVACGDASLATGDRASSKAGQAGVAGGEEAPNPTPSPKGYRQTPRKRPVRHLERANRGGVVSGQGNVPESRLEGRLEGFEGSVGSGVDVEVIGSPLGVADAELIAECLPRPLRVLDAAGAVAVARVLRECVDAGWQPEQIRQVMDQALPPNVGRLSRLVCYRLRANVLNGLPPARSADEDPRVRRERERQAERARQERIEALAAQVEPGDVDPLWVQAWDQVVSENPEASRVEQLHLAQERHAVLLGGESV